MPDFSCGVGDVQTSLDCSEKAGLIYVYATLDSSVNWATMAGSGYYDTATNTILDWALNPGENFYRFTFERKSGRLDILYTQDTNLYEIQLNELIYKGKTAARTLTLAQLASCCGIILSVHANNETARVIGKEFIAGSWTDPLDRSEVSRYLDTTGAYGSRDDVNRDVTDFVASHSTPPSYSSLTITEMNEFADTAPGARVFGFATNKVFGFATNKVFGL
jgi:hypothetical protein